MPFLMTDHYLAASMDQGTMHEFAANLQAGHMDLADIGGEVLGIVRATLDVATDAEVAQYAAKGRGADFTAVPLFYDSSTDDMLRLHVYPRTTQDGEYHGHSRRVVSTLQSGKLTNIPADVEICDRPDSELDVWDCQIVDEVCVPQLNDTVGARLSIGSAELVVPGQTYEVPVDQYHKVAVGAGTVTLCWFARSGMTSELQDGRIIKPRDAEPEPIPTLVRSDVHDIRTALGL